MFHILQDQLITAFIFTSGLMGYSLIVFTDITYLKTTNITLEILLIPITICMHTLRFASQVRFIQSDLNYLPSNFYDTKSMQGI